MENVKSNSKLKTLTVNALMLAALIICSQIIIPMPIGVPFTLQTLAIAILAYALSWKNSLIVTVTYLAAGFLGLPVFSGFSGGPAKLISPSAGYLIGFIPMVALLYLSQKYLDKNKIIAAGFASLALLSCHLPGVLWLSHIVNIGFAEAAMVGSVPFLLKDIVSLVLGAMTAKKLTKFI